MGGGGHTDGIWASRAVLQGGDNESSVMLPRETGTEISQQVRVSRRSATTVRAIYLPATARFSPRAPAENGTFKGLFFVFLCRRWTRPPPGSW